MDRIPYSGLKNVKILDFKENCGQLEILFQKNSSSESCPSCKNLSSSVKNYRIHRVIDKPFSAFPVSLFVKKRRFNCINPSCHIKTFTEEIEGLQRKHIYTKAFEDFLVDLFDHMDYPTVYKHLFKFGSSNLWCYCG